MSKHGQWEKERKDGFKKYYMRSVKGIIVTMIGLFCGTILTKKENTVEYFLISFIVVALFPIISWYVNEIRYKKKK